MLHSAPESTKLVSLNSSLAKVYGKTKVRCEGLAEPR